MENRPKISVIIPVYRVEQYLNRCVQSIIKQTYSNLEIILVDDGSNDNCPKLCDHWAKEDDRIFVIHKRNGGLSDARNVGLEAATGDYILFVDSDDYIDTNMCSRLVHTAEKHESDMVICSFVWSYPEKNIIQSMLTGNKIQSFSNIELLKIYFINKTVELTVAWNKLYRKKLFFTEERIRYPVGRLHEDEFTTFRLIYASKKITIIPDALYYYVQRNASIMSGFSSNNLKDSIAAAETYVPWATQHNLSIEKELSCAYDVLSYSLYLRYLNNTSIDPKQEQLGLFRKFILNNTPSIYLLSQFPLKYRIWDFLLRTNTVSLFHWLFFLKRQL